MNEFFTGDGWPDRVGALVNTITMAVAVGTLIKLLIRDNDRVKEIAELTKLATATQKGVELQWKTWLNENRPDLTKDLTDKSQSGKLILHLKNYGKRAFLSGIDDIKGNVGFGGAVSSENGIIETNAYVTITFLTDAVSAFSFKVKFRDVHHNEYAQQIAYGYPVPEANNMEFTVSLPELA